MCARCEITGVSLSLNIRSLFLCPYTATLFCDPCRYRKKENERQSLIYSVFCAVNYRRWTRYVFGELNRCRFNENPSQQVCNKQTKVTRDQQKILKLWTTQKRQGTAYPCSRVLLRDWSSGALVDWCCNLIGCRPLMRCTGFAMPCVFKDISDSNAKLLPNWPSSF